MEATQKNKYFIDGFMIKHFDVWPSSVDKNDLFEEQKIFLIYLLGFIPEKENWSINVEYQKKLTEIEKMELKDITLEKTDLDLAEMQGRAIEEIKKERLHQEKKRLEKELNEKFGLQNRIKTKRLF